MMTEPHRWVEDNFYMFPDSAGIKPQRPSSSGNLS